MSDIAFEIKWRTELVKRLAFPLKQLQMASDKEAEKQLRHVQKLASFATYEDAQEAYGYNDITRDDLYVIKDLFDGIEKKKHETVTGAALGELIAFITSLNKEVRDLKWEALPDKERERIRCEKDERHERILDAQRQWRSEENISSEV